MKMPPEGAPLVELSSSKINRNGTKGETGVSKMTRVQTYVIGLFLALDDPVEKDNCVRS